MNAVKVTATLVKAHQLEPGDLFSVRGQDYWDLFQNLGSIAEQVYVRTTMPASAAPDADSTVYRISIERQAGVSAVLT